MKLQLGNIENDYVRWLKSYKRHLKYKDVSKNTLEVYTRVLQQLLEFIEMQNLAKKLKELNKDFFLDFIDYREENSRYGYFSKKTKQLYVSILKYFFVYISDNNDEFYTFENEFKITQKGTNKGKKVKYLSDEEVNILMDYIEDRRLNRGTYYDFIYSLGIKLMLYAGLRVSEVLALKLKDISISSLVDSEGYKDMYEIHLAHTKSGEEQTALIKRVDIEEELLYFSEKYENKNYIFIAYKKETLIHRSNFYIGVKTLMQKAGLDKKGLHIFRHTCAMQLYRKSKDILVTKEKLRHSDIKTTMIYAHAEKSDVADAMR